MTIFAGNANADTGTPNGFFGESAVLLGQRQYGRCRHADCYAAFRRGDCGGRHQYFPGNSASPARRRRYAVFGAQNRANLNIKQDHLKVF
jgi:hypothetical protein